MLDVRLIHGDCLSILPTLAAGTVDAVVTDPPYGQTNEAYDSDIAFRPDVWRECFRVAKSNAALLSFAGSPTYHRIASAIEAAGWKVRQMWAWVYRDGFMTSAYPREGFDRLVPAMDPIVFATKGKVLLQLRREGDSWHKLKRDGTPSGRGRENYSDRQTNHGATVGNGHWPKVIASDGVEPFQYFAYRRAQPEADRTGHPNQKPLALMHWLISKLPPGGVVLDHFLGSGSTIVAAVAEGFGCVGIEREAAYLDMARKRIAEAQAATPLFAEVD